VRIIAIVPAFNEEEALPSTLAELREHGPPGLDVVVVSDGSSDRTATVARQAGATAVLELPYNLGIGGALRTGFRYAVSHGYDAAVQYDADGQHDPAQLEVLIAGLEDGANMVVGSRFAAESSHYEVGGARRGAMRFLQVAVRILSGRTFTDTSSGFRGFDRSVLEFFARNYPSEYMESVESLIVANLEGFDVVEVPVSMRQRSAGQPSNRRFRLIYHYLRLLLVIGSRAGRRTRAAEPDVVTT
jgi:glycosyltransferase involved in cell wall biosynthesis